MGVLVQGLHSEVDRSRSCSKEPPFGILLSSLLSAKDIIIPVVTFSAFGRIPTEHNPNVRMADSFLATVSAREENAMCCYSRKEKSPEFPSIDVKGIPFVNCFFQGPSNFGRADLHKESQHWQTLNGYGDVRKDLCDVSPSSSPQNQLLAAFLEGLSNSCLNPFQKHGNARTHCFSKVSSSDRDQKELPLPAGLQKHFYGLSLQGLPHFIVTPCSVFKPDCMDGKDSNSMCFVNTEDSYDLQKPSMTSIFQVFMDHCLLASSNLSKHAVQLLPWNDSLICNSNDLKEDLGGPCTESNCLDKTLQDFQVSSSSHKQDLDNKRKEQKCLRSEPLGFARVGGDPRKPHEQEENLKTTTGLFGVQIPNIERLRSTLATVSLTELMEHIPHIGIARIGGDPSKPHEQEENLKTTTGLFGVQIPNIDRLRSRLATVSLMELMEHIPQIGKTSQDFPDKQKLCSVQDFFRYTEAEGRRFFEELDRDSDGQVTLEDLEVAMRKRRLPQQYAHEFLRRTRKHWFAKSFGWNEFLSLMEQKEPMMLRAFNLLSLSKSGTLQKGQVLSSLQNAGLPASEENAAAMMRYLDADTEGSIAYGQFRNFMLLLPPERLVDDPRMVWFEAATLMPMAPPVAMPAESVLKSALAGGLACALSTSLMHPIDTMKTRVQASSTLSFRELISKLPEIGVRGLYRGSVPAILGQFSSHGLRTGIFEASKLLLTSLAPDVPELQVQSLASLCSTVLGTAVRIPCEVLKQRLQAGMFDSVGDAIIGTWQQDGPKGFFRGTGATLCREVPFYVAGMGIYAELKKVMHQVLNRELAPWETIAVGAMSGGLAAVFTTPFDVMKTRTMTAAPGMSTRMSAIAISIVREEGFLGLFKGAVPRFFWIAPLGAMNFAGYELAKRAMENNKD